MKRLIPMLGALAATLISSHAQLVWLNEFHYDNAGSDSGEFIEIAAPSSLTDLSSVTLTLYNGSGGTGYGTHRLDTFTLGSSSGSYTFYSKVISGIQNGAPDGFSLDQSGTVLQFLSYEGTIQATSGVASGLTSTDVGISESDHGSSVGASLGLTGTGHGYSEFTWTTFSDDTPGALNASQTFSAVPEPRDTALVVAAGLMGFAAFRHWRKCRSRTATRVGP